MLAWFAQLLTVAYVKNPKESGKVHNPVRQRFIAGDPLVIEAMKEFAGYAQECKLVLELADYGRLAELFQLNFECRRRLYGEEAIGKDTIKMVKIANSLGHAAKLSGSGGCVIGLPFDSSNTGGDYTILRNAFEQSGFVYTMCCF